MAGWLLLCFPVVAAAVATGHAVTACAGIANGAFIARSHGILKPYDADTVERVAGACAGAIRLLPPPAGFAAPGPPSPIAGRPTDADLLWLCRHPGHSLAMVEIEGGFVPLIVDERGEGPVIPGEAPHAR